MDDSVRFWRGITLPRDTVQLFGKLPELTKSQRTPISLADVLLHFQQGLLENENGMSDIGIFGFYKLRGFEASKRAYKRTHCAGVCIFNLEKLKSVEPLKRAWMMEDIQFNRDATKAGVVLCKCYRFAFQCEQLREGGCSDMVARDDAPSNAPPEVSTERELDKKSSIEDVARWLRGLFKENQDHAEECVKKFTEEKVTGFMLLNYIVKDTPEVLTQNFDLPAGCAATILRAIESIGDPQRGPSVTHGVTATQTPD